MIKLSTFVMLAVALAILGEMHAASPNSDKSDKVATAVVDPIYRQRHLNFSADGRDFVRKLCSANGVSENEVIREFANQVAMNSLDNLDNPAVLNKKRHESLRATFVGLCIYPGSAEIENAVYEACQWELKNYPSEFSRRLSVIRSQGSVELCREVLDLIKSFNETKEVTNSDFIKYQEYIAGQPSKVKRHNYIGSVHKSDKKYTYIWLVVSLVMLVLVYFRFRRNRSSVLILLLAVAIAVTICALCIYNNRQSDQNAVIKFMLSENASNNSNINILDLDSRLQSRHSTKHSRESVNFSEYDVNLKNENKAAYKSLTSAVEIIMSPFDDLDPVDHSKNMHSKNDAFHSIIVLIDSGKPEKVPDDHWNLLLKHLFEYFDYSDSAMDESLSLIESWMYSGRSEDEILYAMLSTLGWQQTDAVIVGDESHQRSRKIADIFLRLAQNSNDSTCARSLWCASKLRRNFTNEEYISNSPIINANELSEAIMTEVRNRTASNGFREQALLITRSRIEREPNEIHTYNILMNELQNLNTN